MILRPNQSEQVASASAAPVWPVIAARQRQSADSYWLISQPDHARLAGELAAHFCSPRFTEVTAGVAQAIGAHDEGWAMYPAEASISATPELSAEGRPVSFIEFAPPQFLSAWTRSIEAATQVCAAGGVIVSRHFCGLGEFRLKQGALPVGELTMIEIFLARERQRQEQLSTASGCGEPQLAAWLEVLQFCDLLSLYLCCGCRQAVEFPNQLTSAAVHALPMADENAYRLCPSPFQNETVERAVTLTVATRRFPATGEAALDKLEFRLV